LHPGRARGKGRAEWHGCWAHGWRNQQGAHRTQLEYRHRLLGTLLQTGNQRF